MFYKTTALALFFMNTFAFEISLSKEPFIFVRHGTTDWNEANLSQGPQDLEINSQGQKEACEAASIIKKHLDYDIKNYMIYSSCLTRAINTAEIISAEIGVPICIYSNLKEKYFGDFRRRKKLCEVSSLLIPEDAESDCSFRKRVTKVMGSIFNTENSKTSKKILVSHGEVFKFLSLTLTDTQQNLKRGGVALFIPNQDTSKWTIKILN